MIVKAISIRQPWAWLIVHGYKDVENRSWFTRHVGTLYIHAAKGMTLEEYIDCIAFACTIHPSLLGMIPGPSSLPRGGLVGCVEQAGCVIECDSPWGGAGQYKHVYDYCAPLPFYPVRGALGIFDLDLPYSYVVSVP